MNIGLGNKDGNTRQTHIKANTLWKYGGQDISENSLLIKKIIEMSVPVGVGTDATRVSTYNH
jgi:hypothetical protein